jgi:hypothetical protein
MDPQQRLKYERSAGANIDQFFADWDHPRNIRACHRSVHDQIFHRYGRSTRRGGGLDRQ